MRVFVWLSIIPLFGREANGPLLLGHKWNATQQTTDANWNCITATDFCRKPCDTERLTRTTDLRKSVNECGINPYLVSSFLACAIHSHYHDAA